MKTALLSALALSIAISSSAYARQRKPGISSNRQYATKTVSSAKDIFFEDFEKIPFLSVADKTEILPALGWSLIAGNYGDRFEAYYLQDLPGHSGNYYLYSSYDENNARDEWAVTSAISLKGGQQYRVALWVNAPGYRTVTDEFRVMAGTNAASAESLSNCVIDATGDNLILTEDTEWKEAVGKFSPETDGYYFFGINHCSRKDGNFVSFDDIRVSEIPETGAEIAFVHEPYFEYTMVPSSWNLMQALSLDYTVKNVGSNTSSGWKAETILSKNGSRIKQQEQDILLLGWDEAQSFSLNFNDISGSQDDTFACSVKVKDAEGNQIVDIEATPVAGPDKSGEWIARDNGEIAGCISLSLFNDYKTAARIGMRFSVPETTWVKAVKFILLGNYSTATHTVARLYNINKKGTIIEYATSRKENLSTEAAGYTEYTLYFANDIDLAPGDYIVTLDEAAGESMGLALSSNYSGSNLAFSLDAEEWHVMAATPCIRLQTSDNGHISGTGQQGLQVRSLPGKFIIEGLAGKSERLEVYDTTGRKVLDAAIQPETSSIDHNLPPGIYIIRIGGYNLKTAIPY